MARSSAESNLDSGVPETKATTCNHHTMHAESIVGKRLRLSAKFELVFKGPDNDLPNSPELRAPWATLVAAVQEEQGVPIGFDALQLFAYPSFNFLICKIGQ